MMLASVIAAPMLGGWQRMDQHHMATWNLDGWDLPAALRAELPEGPPAQRAYELNRLLGGGSAAEWVGVPAIDPLAGAVAVAHSDITSILVLAWMIPILLALLAGRIFCGWLCPYGTLARMIEAVRVSLPWSVRQVRVPVNRPLRYAVALVALGFAFAGSQLVLYLVLPHLVLQQAAYGAWVLGGAGAALGWLCGMVVAGLLFGTTTYCATLCPTGAVLGALGRARRVRLQLAMPSACGARCELCARACWLSLRPDRGDPGPDCDLCARCVSVCPRANLRIGPGRGLPREAVATSERGVAAAAALLLVLVVLIPSAWGRTGDRRSAADRRPKLLLERVVVVSGPGGDVTAAVAAADLTGLRLDADDARPLSGTQIDVHLARGERGEPDPLGRMPLRESWQGPLEVRLEDREGQVVGTLRYEAPTEPRSTLRQTIYRGRVDRQVQRGDVVVVAPPAGWLLEPLRVQVPRDSPGGDVGALMWSFGGALLLFAALHLLALSVGFWRRPSGTAGGPAGGPVGGPVESVAEAGGAS